MNPRYKSVEARLTLLRWQDPTLSLRFVLFPAGNLILKSAATGNGTLQSQTKQSARRM